MDCTKLTVRTALKGTKSDQQLSKSTVQAISSAHLAIFLPVHCFKCYSYEIF